MEKRKKNKILEKLFQEAKKIKPKKNLSLKEIEELNEKTFSERK